MSYQYTANKDASINVIETNSLGHIYVSMVGLDGSDASHGVVQKSTDQGVTWEVILDEVGSSFTGIEFGANGNVILCGSRTASNTKIYWTCISSTNNSSWSEIDVFRPDPNANGYVRGTVKSKDGTLAAIGSGGDHFIYVRISTDNGTSWKTIEKYDLAPDDLVHDCWFHGGKRRIAALSKGGFAYAIDCKDENDVWYGIVRRYNGTTETWETLDRIENSPHLGEIVADDRDQLYFGGRNYDNGWPAHMELRTVLPGATSILSLEKFRLVETNEGQIESIVIAPNGTIYTIGFCWNGILYSVLRKFSPQ